jgi:glycosyltransferase involved in cell wall biosynthesis/Tfp pilus assembly protein PilF
MSAPTTGRNPLVSVIIHCHNYAHYLPEALASVQNQTFRDFEILVIDSGSTDDTAAVARRLAEENSSGIPIRPFSIADVGPSAGRNYGVGQARGRYVLPLDADDKLAPEYLVRTVPLLEADPKLGFAYPQVSEFGDRQGVSNWVRAYDFSQLRHVNLVPSCTLIRKAAFEEVGGYDPENFGYYEDWQLWIRLGAKGWSGRLVNEPLFFYRFHFKSSLSFYSQRLERFYRAFIVSREASVYPSEEIEAARRTLEEMPPGWHRRPPMRDIHELEKQLGEHPGNKHVMFFLALAYEKQARKGDAVHLLRGLIREHPDDVQALEVLGKMTGSDSPKTNLDPSNPNYANTPAAPFRPRLDYRPADPSAPPVVSIITPFFNGGPVFHETAECVFRQSLQQWEWLIINDGSTEPEALRMLDGYRSRDPRIRVVDHPQNQGPSAARNTGFREAKAEFVFQLDADDLIEPTTLEKMAWRLATHPQVAFTSSFTVGFGSSEYLWLNGFGDGNLFLDENQVTSTCLVRKSVHQAVGGYDEEIRGGLEDWDFWLKAAALGHWGDTTQEFLGWYRRRDTGRERWDTILEQSKFERFRTRLRQRYHGLRNRFPQVDTACQPLAKSFGAEPCFGNRLAKGKRRLLLIVPHFELGGADKFNLTLIEQLQKQHGYEVTVVCTRQSRNVWQHEYENLTPDVFAPHNFLSYEEIPMFLRYLIASRQPEAVLISNSHLGYQLLPYLRAYFPDLPFVDYLHSEVEKWMSGGYPRISIAYQSQLARTIVSSEHLKRWMVARGGDPKHIDVCYTDIDVEQWRRDKAEAPSPATRAGRPKSTPVILYAARIEPGKLPMVFAEAMRRLAQKQPNFLALVRGEGPDLPQLKKFVEREKLRQVRFLGRMSNQAMKELLGITDILFLPTESEGISLAIYEAMAMEVVPVSADVGGQKELVTPDCGILIQRGPEEAADYTHALQKLLASPDKRREMGRAARRRVTEHFHIDGLGRRTHEIVEFARGSLGTTVRDSVLSREQANLHAIEIVEQLRLTEYANGLQREAQRMVSHVKHSVEWQAALRTGQALVELKQDQAAIRSFEEGIRSAVASGSVDVELSARVEISKALVPLDCPLAVATLNGALPLAEKLRSPELREAVEQKVKSLATLLKEGPSRGTAKESPQRQLPVKAAEPTRPATIPTGDPASILAMPAQRRLRITYLISSILGVTGGNQTLLRQADEMRRRGHDVTIVTYTPKPDWFQSETRVVQVPADQPMASYVPPSDVVIATYFTNALELRSVKAPVKVYYAQGDQFVFADATMADTELNRQLRELSRASYLLPGIRFVPNSRNLANAVEKLCGRRPDAILPVCTDQTIFRPLQRSLPGSKFRLLIVGPDARGTVAEPLIFKGVQDIHDALQILAQRYPHFTAVRMSNTPPDIFGRFPCEFYIAPSDEMKTVLFGASHILLYASHYDSCPRPPQEAMAAGCAVVCTATPGAMEYCRDGENSLLVPIRSPEAIADAVERLIKDLALREKLVQGGLATAREYPREREWNEWEKMLQRFVDEPAGKAVKPATATAASSKSSSLARSAKAAPLKLPACALVGHLGEAREYLQRKKFREAWESTQAALQMRPFHPEAWLLLAEIAQAAGDSASARLCAERARHLAPGWKPARRFLNQRLKGNARVDWLVLPESAANRLTVCLIARNEEKFIARCLASVRSLADQIVVVDTGSTDRTVEIAKEHGAEVHSFPWCDDFSAARNAALDRVRGDWVLVLDADEELTAEGREVLLQEMRAGDVMAYRLPMVDVGKEDEGCSYVPRLFRNAPALFYVGRIHEQVFSSIEVRRSEWGMESRLSKATLLHHGYTEEVSQQRNKNARNLRLLEQAIEEMPTEPNLLMNYGLELARAGNLDAALDRYREAFRALQALPEEQVVPELRDSLLTQLCTHLIAAKRFEELVEMLDTPLVQRGGLTASLHFGLGLARMELKNFQEAGEQFRQCLAKRDQPSLTPMNRDIRKAGPHHCLAICLMHLGEFDAAAEAFQQALAADPQSRRVRFDFAAFLFSRGLPLEALQQLHALVAEKPDELPVWLLGGQIALSQPQFSEFACDWTGEAIKQFPQERTIALQRAEALLLGERAVEALPLWRDAGASSNDATHRAARILCELVAGEPAAAVPSGDEPAISREFLKWYRRLITTGKTQTVAVLNDRIDRVADVLPTTGKILGAALAEAQSPTAGAATESVSACL